NGDGTFAPAVHYLTEVQSTAVTAVQTGDLNGDGHPDIVAGRWDRSFSASQSYHLVILWNDGNGAFPTLTAYNLPSWAMEVAVSDLNGDGHADVAVSADGTSISVYTNNGDGTLAPPVDYPVNGSRGMNIGDLNGDGHPDMVSSDGGSNTISVLINNGDGTFAPRITYPTGSYAHYVSIGDLNGDGRNDLAVANRNDNTVSVLLNNGNGTFAAHATYAVGSSPVGTTIGDLDGDGHADIVASNQSDDFVSVLINRGDGTFYPQRKIQNTEFIPFAAVIADLDSDGRNDLAVAGGGYSKMHVFLNRGSYAPTGNILYVNQDVDQYAPGYIGNG